MSDGEETIVLLPICDFERVYPTSDNLCKVGIFRRCEFQPCPQDLSEVFPVKIPNTVDRYNIASVHF